MDVGEALLIAYGFAGLALFPLIILVLAATVSPWCLIGLLAWPGLIALFILYAS